MQHWDTESLGWKFTDKVGNIQPTVPIEKPCLSLSLSLSKWQTREDGLRSTATSDPTVETENLSNTNPVRPNRRCKLALTIWGRKPKKKNPMAQTSRNGQICLQSWNHPRQCPKISPASLSPCLLQKLHIRKDGLVSTLINGPNRH